MASIEPLLPPEPWVRVTDETAASAKLVAELLRELAVHHVLHARPLHAVARCSGCDDVVFRLEDDGTFAIVHLTWSGHRESPPWPGTTVLPTFIALESVLDAHDH
jgi:hypothetical protein